MRWRLSFDELMVGLLFGVIVAVACLMPSGPDTYWHLRAGEDIWRTSQVPLTDTYSFTAFGQPWPNHEWLWQALSFGLFQLGGQKMLVVGSAVLVVGAFTIAFRLMTGPTSTRFLILLLGLPIASCMWTPRPQLLSLLFLAILVWLLVRERFWPVPIVFVAWANAHGVVALGCVVLGAATCAAALRAWTGGASDRRRAIALGLLFPVCVLATTLTPLGFGLWPAIQSSIAFSRVTRLVEWQTTYPQTPFGVAFLLLAFAFVFVLVKRRGHVVSAPWGDWVLVAGALSILPLAIFAVRNTPMFLLVGMPAVTRLLPSDRPFRFMRWAEAAPRSHVNSAMLLAILLAQMGTVAWLWRGRFKRLGWDPVSPGALAEVERCPAPTYNHYNDGGYLIWFARRQPVFLDGRQDPYPLSLVLEHLSVEGGASYRPLFERFKIGCAILRADAEMVRRLSHDGWQYRFRDGEWVVLGQPPSL